jgi:hypothetical protein
MLMEMAIDTLYLVALLMGPRLAMGIDIVGANGVQTEVSNLLLHFFHLLRPMQKMANAISIMVAGDENIQWALAGLTWSSSLNSSLELLSIVFCPDSQGGLVN